VTLPQSYDNIVLITMLNFLGGVVGLSGSNVLEKEYRIHYYEVDAKGRVLIASLMRYFDDIATQQSRELGVGINYLKEHNVAWMLYQWDIKINKYPRYGETIKIRTAPYSFRKFYAYRWFDVLNKDGERLVTANSVWLFVDTDKRRPLKIPDVMYEAYQVTSDEPLEIGEIKELSSCDIEKKFQVRYSDIDTNSHVNNVVYVTWALEALPYDIILNYELRNLKVTYKQETTYGMIIRSQAQVIKSDDEVITRHSILSEEGKKLCLLEGRWIKHS
jgi:medium-chain acyl-[acyl-carrier-protein] hydrolase